MTDLIVTDHRRVALLVWFLFKQLLVLLIS